MKIDESIYEICTLIYCDNFVAFLFSSISLVFCTCFRPVYQPELTALEAEIEQLWEDYVVRFRCVEALKHQLSLLETAQNEVV